MLGEHDGSVACMFTSTNEACQVREQSCRNDKGNDEKKKRKTGHSCEGHEGFWLRHEPLPGTKQVFNTGQPRAM